MSLLKSKRAVLRTTNVLVSSCVLLVPVYSASGYAEEVLGTIEVVDEKLPKEGEKVEGYVAKSSVSATKTNIAITETPQSVSVVTRDQMDDQGAIGVREALRYSAGVGAERYGFDSRGDATSIRGSDPVIFLDGLQKSFGFYSTPRTESYTLESIDVIRGPASVLYGQGSVGGVVNLVSKRPQETPSNEVELQLGNHNRKQVSLDSTGKLNEEGSLLYRIVLLGRDSDTQVDHVDDDRRLIMPSITWRPSKDTEWMVSMLRQEDHSGTSSQFLPLYGTLYDAPYGLPTIASNTFISEPDFDKYDADETAITSLLRHRINDTWQLSQNLRYSESDVVYQTIYPIFTPSLKANGDIARVAYSKHSYLNALTADNRAQANFSVGKINHNVLVGLDYQHAESGGKTAYLQDIGDINVYEPVYGNYTPITASDYSDIKINTLMQTGVYLQDQVDMGDHWIALLGGRYDSSTNRTEGSDTDRDYAFTKRVGVMYQMDSGVNPFISYSESFTPVMGVNFYGDSFKPIRGEQTEVGVKYQPIGSDSLYTATIYNLHEKNRKMTDPNNASNSIQAGKTRTRGVELEAKAALSNHWGLIANYAYSDTEVLKGANEGKRIASIPEHNASLWSQHELAELLGVEGLRAGVGLRYVGSSWGGADKVKTPYVTLLDAMLAYGRDNWEASLHVSNVENKPYYATCLARGDCFFGSGRTIVGSFNYQF
ncbi:TonB-dependent siderophore receptor [Marinomonas sp. M1K-6]|uniref:TonB-dependent siderophore receptor n=1 Tax=Marinomonas profundi TaxID=2726122 RepID=A0A847QZF2_9GAMM|nr:TonB-dependent siderophore receptor [Marinomonas profundi]NLQ16245.1 TonB-dependent siderophore receptor [Marinomonas profundi]UDV03178.1 TonB-dependent siderophore receptor [Marinomonas profundi]